MSHKIIILTFLTFITACSHPGQKDVDLTTIDIVSVDSNQVDTICNPVNSVPISITNDTTLYTDLDRALKFPNKVYRLNLAVDSVPMAIIKFKNLRELKLKGEITHLPGEIGQLKNLKHLDLSKNHLANLPAEIGNLENLETLILDENFDLTSLPKEMGILNKLKYLSLSTCWTNHFPPVICELENLTFLNAMKTGIDTVPACLGKLKNLRTLIINNNPISKLPPEIGKLSNLEELWLINTQVNELPDEFGQLSNLEYLWIYPNEQQRARLAELLPNTKLDRRRNAR